MRIPLTLLLCLLLPTPVVGAADDDLLRRLAACASCHGSHGEGVGGGEYIPHLSGKPAGYLLDQLRAFRDGRRHYAPMVWLVRNLDDAYLAEIAEVYAAQTPRTRAETGDHGLTPAQRARAEQLVTEGDAGRGLPACSACHGEALTGLEPGVPALVGLPADYLIAQLGAWRVGVRAAREPDCMREIARRLDDADLRVLGQWLAAQGHAEPTPPAAAGSVDLPVACGALGTANDDAAVQP
jgi:cytochrome c553